MMRKRLTLLGVALAVASVLAVPVLAAGGEGTQATDVCYVGSEGAVRANFQTTASGIVHEFVYDVEESESDDRHLVFKPKAEFPNEPDEGDWFSWTGKDYPPCEGETDLVTDFLPAGTEYWVKSEVQE